MKTFRLLAALLVAALLTPLAFPQESSEVASLLAKARRGNGIAQYNVGLAYLEGRGIAADPVEAFVWLSLARENGARGRALDNLIGSFDRATLDLAQRRLAQRKTELGVRTPTSTTVRTETTAPAQAVATPGPAAKESVPAPKASAAAELPQAVQPQTDDSLVRLQAERDALATRFSDAAADVTALRAERERLIGISAGHEKAARIAAEANQVLQEQVRGAEARSTELSLAADTTKGELARVRLALTAAQKAAKPAAPDTAALDQKTRELQAALKELEESRAFGRQVEDTLNKVNDDRVRVAAAAAAELEAARAFGQQVESTLNRITDQKTALETALRTTEAARDGYAREYEATKSKLAEMETRARDATVAANAKPAAPAYPDLSGRVTELEAQLVKARQPSAPAYPDLRSRVTDLETKLAAQSSDLSAVASAKAAADAQVAMLTKAKEEAAQSLAARPALPNFPDLRGRVTELERELAAVRTSAPAYPDLRGNVTELETKLARLSSEAALAKQGVAALAKAKDDAQQQLAALTQTGEASRRTLAQELDATKAALAQANDSLRAKPAAPAYPDLSGRVAELESAYTAASTTLAQTQAALAAKPAGPAYPDLSGRVAELETQLTQVRSTAPAAPAYPNLAGKVTELETALASLSSEATRTKQEAAALAKAKDDAIQKAGATELARAEVAKQFDDYRSTTAAAQRERTTLLANVKMLESDKASLRRQAESAGTEAGQLRTQVATLKEQLSAKPAVTSAPAYPDLSGRVAELETAFTATSTALAQAQATLAAKPSAPVYPDLSGRVASLESQLAAASNAAPAYPDYTNLVKELTTEVTKLRTVRDNQQESLAATERRVAELAASTKRVKELEAQVGSLQTSLAAVPTAPAYPDLSGRVAELESAYTAASTTLAQAQAALAAKPAAPAYPDLSGKVAGLETQLGILTNSLVSAVAAKTDAEAKVAALTRAQAERSEPISAGSLIGSTAATRRARELEAKPAYPDLSGRVSELEAQLAQAKAAPASVSPAAASHVTELESALADSARKLLAADNAQAQLQQQLAAAQAAAKAKSDGDAQISRERDELNGRVTLLNSEVAQLRNDRERMQKMLGDAGRQMRDTTAAANRIKELEAQAAGLQNSLAALSSEASQAKEHIAALTKAKEEAQTQPTHPDLSGRVAELESALAARPTAPAYPDLSGRVSELEARLAQAQSAAPAYPDLSGRVAELEAQVTRVREPISAGALPYPDLSNRVRELEAQLAAAPKSRAPVYPNLAGRVVELESALADSKRQLSDAEAALRSSTPVPVATVAAAPETDSSDLQKRLAETEDKLATALRGYALLEKDRDARQARSGQAAEALAAEKNSLAEQVTALTAQVQQLQGATAAAAGAERAAVTVTAEKDALATRVAELENRAATAQAEAARLGESLAALQRSTGQITGDAVSNRALVQQLQGTNAVLAQENYQLKTMLSRTTGGPATPVAVPASLPAARTHVVVSGDSLSRISQRYYGTAGRWQEIYNANSGKLGPNGILRVGTELRIP